LVQNTTRFIIEFALTYKLCVIHDKTTAGLVKIPCGS